MDAVKFLKIIKRLCANRCTMCPLNPYHTSSGCVLNINPEKAVELVEKWAKENPEKTYLHDLMERFPNMSLNDYGIPYPCRATLYDKDNKCRHSTCNCIECWNEPMEV